MMSSTSSNQYICDYHERELALDAKQSFIIQAPAGSGKTELLIQRFLTLLCVVKTPEEILAITFTKKAANEMRSRIINALKLAHLNIHSENKNTQKTAHIAAQVLKRDGTLGWHLLSNPNRLHIQTIDALCVYLTKSLPLLSGLGAQASITDFPDQHYREAVVTTLQHLEDDQLPWSSDIEKILIHFDNDINKLEELLIELLRKRDQWLPYIHLDMDNQAIKQTLEKHLTKVINQQLQALSQQFSHHHHHHQELLAILHYAGFHLDLAELPAPRADNLQLWQTIAFFLLTKQYTWRKRVDREIGFLPLSNFKNKNELNVHKSFRKRYADLIQQFQDNETLLQLLKETLLLPRPYYHTQQWQILKSLFQVLKVVIAQLRLIFQQHGHIDFIENSEAALLALGNDERPTDLLLALDYSIQHILIDEFQDTAYTQFHLLEKLILGWEENDGRTLFVVGDPMQSIYRFREAEVGLFIRMRQSGIGNVKLKSLTLSTNFRSSPEIVNWNNHHFQAIFPRADDIATGAVSYSASVASKTQSSLQPIIHACAHDVENRTQALTIIEVIKQHQLNGPNDSIAILVRSRSHLENIIPLLKKQNIPFQALDIDPLVSRQYIQDLLALCCGLIHLADKISWLSILRAPWCGLRLADLLTISRNCQGTQLIWQQLLKEEVIAQLSEDGQLRIQKLMLVLKKELENRYRFDLRTWLETTWQQLGGPATLNNEFEMRDTEAFFSLLSSLQHENTHLNIDILKEKINSHYASTQKEEDCQLQLMTIHSAKGLEFDMVIVPHLERPIPNDDKTLLNWIEQPLTDDENALLIAPLNAPDEEKDILYEYIYNQKRLKSTYETDRLFYVATTRAKKSLHLFYNLPELNEDCEAKIKANTFLQKIWSFIPKNGANFLNTSLNNNLLNDAPFSLPVKRKIKRLTHNWYQDHNFVTHTQQKIFFHQQSSGFLLSDNIAKTTGIVVHLILQNIGNHGSSFWQNKTSKEQQQYCQQQLDLLGEYQTDKRDVVENIQRMIANTLQDARGQWLFQQHRDAKSEYAITVRFDQEIKHCVIDRTFIDENDIRWIVDFKTSTCTDSHELQTFMEMEYEKYKEQMHLYYHAFQLQENRPIQLALYFPAIPAFKAWQPVTN